MKHIYIYGLIDPELNLIKYVGATNDLTARYQGHLMDIDKSSTKKGEWITALASKNIKPYLVLLETTDEVNAASCELKWAETYKSNNLYNFFPIVPYTNKGNKSELISIRIEKGALLDLKSISDFMGIKYQTLIKKWINENIKSYRDNL